MFDISFPAYPFAVTVYPITTFDVAVSFSPNSTVYPASEFNCSKSTVVSLESFCPFSFTSNHAETFMLFSGLASFIITVPSLFPLFSAIIVYVTESPFFTIAFCSLFCDFVTVISGFLNVFVIVVLSPSTLYVTL